MSLTGIIGTITGITKLVGYVKTFITWGASAFKLWKRKKIHDAETPEDFEELL